MKGITMNILYQLSIDSYSNTENTIKDEYWKVGINSFLDNVYARYQDWIQFRCASQRIQKLIQERSTLEAWMKDLMLDGWEEENIKTKLK